MCAIQDNDRFIKGLPKAELHLHIEGSLEPEMMFLLAERNHVQLPFANIEAVRAAYNFSDLQDFLLEGGPHTHALDHDHAPNPGNRVLTRSGV